MAKVKNVRAQAARCVARVLVNGESLTQALEAGREEVAPRDIGLLSEICFGVMRHYYQLDAVARQLLTKRLKPRDRDVHALILAGLYQLIYMRVPNHAALNETVQATRDLSKQWARGLVNAILRSYLRDSERLLNEVGKQSQVNSELPDWLFNRLKKAWPDSVTAICEASQAHPPMSLRVNLAQTGREAYLAELTEAEIEAFAIEGTEAGIQLQSAVNVEALPGFAEGRVSVQDAAAQLASSLLDAGDGQRVLDACAAPGGKTAAILERARAEDISIDIVALDNNELRLQRVEDNLQRLGLNAEVMCADATEPDSFTDSPGFDRILLDAPCSATGVIRRHPDIKLLRRDSDITELVATQSAMLDTLWACLKPGGHLLYATCSILPDENSGQVHAFLSRHKDATEQAIQVDGGNKQPQGGVQIMPGVQGMDGFFYALLVKKA